MQESYKFQVICRGGDGIVFEMSPDQTLLHMMSFICEHWLNEYRDGDGSVLAHYWKFCHHDDNAYPPETHHFWTLEQQIVYENHLMIRNENLIQNNIGVLPIDVSLKHFRWWNVGTSVLVNYDTGSATHMTYFQVSLLATKTIAEDIALPRIVPDEADKQAETFTPFEPKEGSPSLNDIFPHANRIMFEMGSKWLSPYPSSDSSGGFVESGGGGNSDSDLVFIPEPFESLHHALIGINRAAEECPDATGYCRFVWSMELSPSALEFYNRTVSLVQEYLDFQQNVDQRSIRTRTGAMDMRAVVQLSENIQDRLFSPQTEFYYRLTQQDVDNFVGIRKVDEIFPLCSKAYQDGLWVSYHRGKVKICKGSDTGERGVPQTIVAQVTWEVHSLQDFCCVAEGLLQMEKNNHVFEALKKSVALDPHLINGRKSKAN